MSVYYIRKTGSDAAAGTSAATAWATIGKALGASGIASGDTVWWGAGTYREVITVNMTSATVETKIYADVDGAQTGDAGEVISTAYLVNDTVAPSASSLLNLNGRDFLTFQDITFIYGSATGIASTISVSTNITLRRCQFLQGAQGTNVYISHTTAANVASNWIIDSCIFIKSGGSVVSFTLIRPATADFDYNITIKNCLFLGSTGSCIIIASSGANTFNGGGIVVRNCSSFAGGVLVSANVNTSTTIPAANVYNCLIYSGTSALSANASGQIVEDNNIMIGGATPRTNVTAGVHSISDGSYSPNFYTGHEYISVGSNLKPFGMPKPGSPLLGFGNQSGSPTTDILGAARPSGLVKVATGTATSGAAKTITNSGATFGTNALAGNTIKIISGTGSGQTKTIASNTATVITVDGNWKTNPDSTSVYEIYLRATSSSGTATAGSTTTLTDGNAAWGVNMFAGYTLEIDAGTGSPQSLLVISNTATVLTFATATAPDATSTYKIYRGASENVINAGVGCYENGQSGIQESTSPIRIGSNSFRIPGAGYTDIKIPVDVGLTTISVYAQYDSAYSGTLPSINIVNAIQCGVSNATSTQAGAANTWEQLSLSFTPTVKGIITIRLISGSTTPTGNAFFSDLYGFDYYRRGEVLDGFAFFKKILGFNRLGRRFKISVKTNKSLYYN